MKADPAKRLADFAIEVLEQKKKKKKKKKKLFFLKKNFKLIIFLFYL